MTRQIEISDETYERLAKMVIGFDSPENVISRLLNQAEGKTIQKPELFFEPESEDEFKVQLLKSKEAEITLYKNDGSREILYWNASRFKPESNLRGNLWSGQLRGWQQKGIVKAELIVLPAGTADPGDDTGRIKNIAMSIGVKFSELEEVFDFCEIQTNESEDGLIYSYILEFDDECPKEFLNKVEGLNNGTWIYLSPNIFDEPDFENEEEYNA